METEMKIQELESLLKKLYGVPLKGQPHTIRRGFPMWGTGVRLQGYNKPITGERILRQVGLDAIHVPSRFTRVIADGRNSRQYLVLPPEPQQEEPELL